jgi:hypothetical protein
MGRGIIAFRKNSGLLAKIGTQDGEKGRKKNSIPSGGLRRSWGKVRQAAGI